MKDRIPVAVLGELAPHEVHRPDLEVQVDLHFGGELVQAAEGPGAPVPRGPAQGQVRMEGPRFPFEAQVRQGPLEILLEAAQASWISSTRSGRTAPRNLRVTW